MEEQDDNLSKPSLMRTLIIGLLPALIVFVAEEATHPSKVHDGGAVADIRTAEEHAFSKQTIAQLTQISTNAQRISEQLDKVIAISGVNGSSCLLGLKTGVYNYVGSMLSRLTLDMTNSINMKNHDDENFINSSLGANSGIVIQALPVLKKTIVKMDSACPDNPQVKLMGNQMDTFIDTQISPMLKVIQARALDSTNKDH